MVKLHFRIIEKSYKKGLRVYKHEEVTLNFPKELHELLRVLCDKKLEIRGFTEGNKVLSVSLSALACSCGSTVTNR
jgi:hypothetical protein